MCGEDVPLPKRSARAFHVESPRYELYLSKYSLYYSCSTRCDLQLIPKPEDPLMDDPLCPKTGIRRSYVCCLLSPKSLR